MIKATSRKINITATLIFLFSVTCLAQEIPRIIFLEQQGSVQVDRCDGYLLHLLSQKKLSTEDWHNLLVVHVINEKTGKVQHDLPILGKYVIKEQKIHFHPRFPFRRGVNYLAKFNIPYFYALVEKNTPLYDWQKIVELPFKLKHEPVINQTFVNNIYPDSDTLPVNQLKLYIHFSGAMREGMAYDHIQLLDQNGQQIKQPFLELMPELWDNSGSRLTIWFDPGRIKRGLSPNELQGLPLKQGNKYVLAIDSNWKDRAGHQLRESFKKEFYVTAADRKAPVITEWILHIPARSTTKGLSLQFNEAMDHALLNRMVTVTSQGKALKGEIKISNHDNTWTFIPAKPWEKVEYQISVNTRIEDLAGNSLRRLFDTPISDTHQGPKKEKELMVPFKTSRKAKIKKVRKYKFRTSPN